MLKVQTLTLKG